MAEEYTATIRINPKPHNKDVDISKSSARASRHERVLEELRQRILTGGFNPGDKLLTDRDVMKEFKVGRTTARTAIDSLVKENLLARKPGCGTFLKDPRESSDADETRKTRYKILLVYQDLTKPHASSDASYMLAATHDALNKMGVFVSLLALPDTGEQAYHILKDHLGKNNYDGFIMHATRDERLYELVDHLPVVTNNFVVFSHVVSVIPDARETVRIAIDHLLALGHRKIGLVTELRHSVQLAILWTFAFEQILHDLGNPVRREWICTPRDRSELETGIKKMLRQEDRPTAILAVGPDAVGLTFQMAHSEGIVIPQQLSVFGYGHGCKYLTLQPTLTHVTFNLGDYGEQQASALQQQLEGKIPNRNVRQVPVHLVVGESTASPEMNCRKP